MNKKKEDNKNIKKKLSTNENIIVTYLNKENKELFVMVFNELKQNYSLYSINEDKTYLWLGSGSSPLKLEERFKVDEQLKKS